MYLEKKEGLSKTLRLITPIINERVFFEHDEDADFIKQDSLLCHLRSIHNETFRKETKLILDLSRAFAKELEIQEIGYELSGRVVLSPPKDGIIKRNRSDYPVLPSSGKKTPEIVHGNRQKPFTRFHGSPCDVRRDHRFRMF